MILAILNLLNLVKVEEHDKEMDSVETKLISLLDDAKKQCVDAVEERDMAVAKL